MVASTARGRRGRSPWSIVGFIVAGLAILMLGSVELMAGGANSCVSVNGNEQKPASSTSSCRTQDQGDRAIATRNSNAFGLGDFTYGPAQGTARNNSQSNAQTGSVTLATNFSSAAAVFGSEARADDSSLAEASTRSYASATGGDSSAIAKGFGTRSATAIATNGACAYAESGFGGPSTAIADGPGVIVIVINGLKLTPPYPKPVNQYCRSWPAGEPPWPG